MGEVVGVALGIFSPRNGKEFQQGLSDFYPWTEVGEKYGVSNNVTSWETLAFLSGRVANKDNFDYSGIKFAMILIVNMDEGCAPKCF